MIQTATVPINGLNRWFVSAGIMATFAAKGDRKRTKMVSYHVSLNLTKIWHIPNPRANPTDTGGFCYACIFS